MHDFSASLSILRSEVLCEEAVCWSLILQIFSRSRTWPWYSNWGVDETPKSLSLSGRHSPTHK